MIRIAGAALVAGIVGWMLHTAPCGGGGAAAPLSTVVVNESVPVTGEAPVLHWIANEIEAQPSGRNLFAFDEKPQPQPKAQVVVVEAPRAIETPALTQPSEPSFDYRCLGTFGPASQRFAVFAGADEIVNARIGDAIGRSAFVLRDIGIKAVTIEQGAFTRRVEIGH